LAAISRCVLPKACRRRRPHDERGPDRGLRADAGHVRRCRWADRAVWLTPSMAALGRWWATLLITGGLFCSATAFGIGAATTEPSTYALPACYGGDTQPMERPGQAQFQTCADGSKELTDLTWTAFGPDGADGTGTYSYQVCEPNCAAGHRVFFPAVVHADEPLPQIPGAGCPAGTMFYTNLVIAYPHEVPGPDGGGPTMRFRGMPATLYSTAATPETPTSLADPRC
jgi:hypothetical protein